MGQVIRENVTDFNLDHIFDCGQAFRWEKEQDGSYTGIAGKRVANVQFSQKDKRLILSNTDEKEFETFWRKYLDLDRDYGTIKKALASKDPVIQQAIEYGQGIRLLQQDKWETLLSFIISQNNHIPRIKKCIQSLCENFGTQETCYRGTNYYSFPAPETLAALEAEDLAPCKLGYRAKYIIETARQVTDQGMELLEKAGRSEVSSQEAFSYVTEFCGVGPKVANCILLFSMGKYDRFPVDVWMKKVMKELYGLEKGKDIEAFAQNAFGVYGGMAQQYLFYYIREKG